MGTDKSALPWGGTTMLAHIVSVLRPHCGAVMVVVGADQPEPEVDAHVVRDDEVDQGPLLGLAVGLEAAAGLGFGRAFVCATDMPLLDASVIATLVQAPEAPVVLAEEDGRPQPLAGIYATSLASQARVALLEGRRSMFGFLASQEVATVRVPDATRLANTNTPEELNRARALGTRDQ
jgi:molybdopterin-guanine dinucleotide biosynthesis protein A